MSDSASIPLQPLAASDFSGGMTDFPDTAKRNQYEIAQNFDLDQDARLLQRNGFILYDSDNIYRTPNFERLDSIYEVTDLDFRLYGANGWMYQDLYPGSGLAVVPAADVNTNTTNIFTSGSTFSCAYHNRHVYICTDQMDLPAKIYLSSASTPLITTAGLAPAGITTGVATFRTLTVDTSGFPATDTYQYAFILYRQYSLSTGSGTLTFIDQGPVQYYTFTGASVGSVGNKPKIYWTNGAPTNGTGEAYQWTGLASNERIQLLVYRTVANGNVFYLAKSTPATTPVDLASAIEDDVEDADLVVNAQLYINGGRLSNGTPPRAKYITVCNDIAWYAHLKEYLNDDNGAGATLYYRPNRLRHSIRGDLDSCPAVFYTDFEEDIVGLGSYNIYPIVFCSRGVYRVEGFRDELGRGSIQKREISRTAGCLSNQSIVSNKYGIFWAGTDSFYHSDGFRTQKIFADCPETYKAFTDTATKQGRIQGTYDRLKNKIYWTVQNDSTRSDNDAIFVLDLRFGVRENSSFTHWSFNSTLSPTSVCWLPSANQLVIGTDGGYLLKQDELTYDDPKIDGSKSSPTDWSRSAILVDYQGYSTSFGTSDYRKWVPGITWDFENLTNFFVTGYGQNDNNEVWMEMAEMRWDGTMTFGDPEITFGDTDYDYIFGRVDEQTFKRRFPKKSLRCMYKQVRLTNAFANLYNSDDYGVATVAAASPYRTATIAGTWPSDIEDYYLTFEADSYTQVFKILRRDSDTQVTFIDPDGDAGLGATIKWVIRGYKKGQRIKLKGYTMNFTVLGQTQAQFRGAAGGNA